MTADIVNLRTARKARARSAKQTLAAENRAKFGQTKAARQQTSAQALVDNKRLDGAKREPSTRDD